MAPHASGSVRRAVANKRGLARPWSVCDYSTADRSQAMTPSIQLKPGDRNALLRLYRRSPDPRVRLRAHVLLLAHGHTWATTAAVLYTSSSTIARWQRRFWAGGLAAVCGRGSDRPPRAGPWAAVAVAWVLCLPPAAFGLARSRWCCEAVA